MTALSTLDPSAIVAARTTGAIVVNKSMAVGTKPASVPSQMLKPVPYRFGRWVLLLTLCISSSLQASLRADVAVGSEPALWQLDIPMLVIEPDTGAIVDANRAALILYGYSVDAIRHLNIADINTLTEQQVAAERTLAVKEQRNYFLFRHRMADGSIQRVSVHSVPFQRDGRILLLSLIQPLLAERQPADESVLYQQRLEAQVDAQTSEIEASKRQQRYLLGAVLLLQAGLIAYLLHALRRGRTLTSQLAQALKQLQLIMDAAPDLVILATDPAGRVRTANRVAERMLSLEHQRHESMSLAELIGQSCRLSPDQTHADATAAIHHLTTSLSAGQTETIELHCHAPHSESWTRLRMRFNRLHDATGANQGLVCIARDLSHQSQTERMLQVERELFSTGPVFIVLWEMSAGWPVNYISRNIVDVLGYSATEFMAADFRFGSLLHPDDVERVASEVDFHLAARTSSFEQTYRLRHRNGDYRWFFDLSKPQYDEQGKARTVQGYLFDQTPLIQVQQALEAERRRLAGIIEATDVGTWEWNLTTDETVFNERWAGIVGYTLEELGPSTFGTWAKLLHPDDRTRSEQALRALFDGQAARYECEVRVRHKDGHWVWILDRGNITERDQQGRPLWMMGTHQDISQRKQDEARLQLSASVFTHAREGILITDANARILEINEAFTAITGYQRSEVINQTPRLLRSGQHDPEFYRDMWASLLREGHWQGELWNRRADGELYAEMLTISAIRNADGDILHFVGLFNDITPLKLQQQQLENIAHYDALTGLPNRVLLSERLRQAMQSARSASETVAVVFIDLDGFKAVNDRYGHTVGDEMLIVVTQRLRGALCEGDTLARIGGDEFVVILNHAGSRENSEIALNRLLLAASAPVTLNDQPIQVSASLGATCFPADSADAEQLIRHADHAMYIAKQSGKNRFQWFDVERDEAAKSHSQQLQRVLAALRDNEFALHMQPIVNMRSGHVQAFEALIRWPDPDGPMRLPGQFLPAIDGHPVAVQLDLWVIDRALRQLCEWHREGIDVPVCINISATSLQSSDLVERLREGLERYPQVPSRQLKLEVLETSALEDMPRTAAIMRACRDLGLRFSLDDFGTGYSSLTYLRRLPADQLKIDQGFIRNMLDSPEDLTIVEGVLGLATAFGRGVIAEGVESVAHGELLLALGCELAQGYGIARPMPADSVKQWLQQWKPPAQWTQWQDFQPSRRNLPVLMAQTRHRAWMRDIRLYCSALETHFLPQLDPTRCGFQQSFLKHELEHLGNAPLLRIIHGLHDELHEVGERIILRAQQSKAAEVSEGLLKLADVSDQLIDQLYRLIRTRAAN